MTKAKLIKKEKLNKQPRLLALPQAPEPSVKRPAEIVREWIGQRRQASPSARQAFAALFNNSEPDALT